MGLTGAKLGALAELWWKTQMEGGDIVVPGLQHIRGARPLFENSVVQTSSMPQSRDFSAAEVWERAV